MLRNHREKIDSCTEYIAANTDLPKLWPKLLEQKIFNRDDVNVPRWTRSLSERDTVRDVYTMIKTRGPQAFERLLVSLRQTGHEKVADLLEGKELGCPDDELRVEKFEDNPIENSNRDEDNFFNTMQLSKEPLRIQVRKAEAFLDGPAYVSVQRYPMRSRPRGLVLLITNIRYRNSDKHYRHAAEHDETNVSELFNQMGFEVEKHRDLTGQELIEKVKTFSKRPDFRRVDSAFVVIGSHGDTNPQNELTEIHGIDYYSDAESSNCQTVLCADVLDCFTAEACPNLAGKPKVFIFQICRGEKKQKAVNGPRHATDSFNSQKSKSSEETYNKIQSTKGVRKYADMLFAHATIPGHVAFRDRITGSWFIQILCEVFMNYAYTTHLQDLLHMVDERLNIQRTMKEYCQTLAVTSVGFNKHCYLNPGLFEEM